MSNKEKSIYIIEFLGKKVNQESWSKKFLLHWKQKGYKKLLVSSGSMSGMDEIPTQDEYENALKEDMDLNIKIIKLDDLNELAYEDFILLINTGSSVCKLAFGLVWNAKSTEFLKENCKIAWNRLVSKYAPRIASPLLKLKNEFHNSKLELIKKTLMSGSWIWKGLEFEWTNLAKKSYITDEDFMIHALKNLPEEYDVILDGFKNCLTSKMH